MSIYRVVDDAERHVVVLMKESRGAWSESTLDLASTDPPVIAGMMGHPVPPPESAANPASNDEELAARVGERVAGMGGPDAYSGAV